MTIDNRLFCICVNFISLFRNYEITVFWIALSCSLFPLAREAGKKLKWKARLLFINGAIISFHLPSEDSIAIQIYT